MMVEVTEFGVLLPLDCQHLLDHRKSKRVPEKHLLSLLQRIFPTQGWNPASHIAGLFFTSRATRKAQEYGSG